VPLVVYAQQPWLMHSPHEHPVEFTQVDSTVMFQQLYPHPEQ